MLNLNFAGSSGNESSDFEFLYPPSQWSFESTNRKSPPVCGINNLYLGANRQKSGLKSEATARIVASVDELVDRLLLVLEMTNYVRIFAFGALLTFCGR